MRFSFRRLLTSLVLPALLLAGQLNGQTLGTVTGEVKDSTGAVVAGATVTVRNTATNGSARSPPTKKASTPSRRWSRACTT